MPLWHAVYQHFVSNWGGPNLPRRFLEWLEFPERYTEQDWAELDALAQRHGITP